MSISTRKKTINKLQDIEPNKKNKNIEENEFGEIEEKENKDNFLLSAYNNEDFTSINCISLINEKNFIKIPENIYLRANDYKLINLVYFYLLSHCGDNELVSFSIADMCLDFGLQISSSGNVNIQNVKDCLILLVKQKIIFQYLLPFSYDSYMEIKNFYKDNKNNKINEVDNSSPFIISKRGILFVSKNTSVTIDEWVKNFENVKPTDRLCFYCVYKRNPPQYGKFIPLYYQDINTIMEYCYIKNLEIIQENSKHTSKEKMFNPTNMINVFIIICSYMERIKRNNNIEITTEEEKIYKKYNNFKSYINIAKIASELEIDIKTVSKIISYLEEMGILIVYRTGLSFFKNNKEDKEDKDFEEITREDEEIRNFNNKEKKIYKKKNVYFRPFNPAINKENYIEKSV